MGEYGPEISGAKGKVLRAATHEGVLLTWRVWMAAASIFIGSAVVDIRDGNKEIKKDFTDYRLNNTERVARLEGTVDGIKGSVDVHRGRLAGLDEETKRLWSELLAMIRNPGQQQTPRR